MIRGPLPTLRAVAYWSSLFLASWLPRGLGFRIASWIGRLDFRRRRRRILPQIAYLHRKLGGSPEQIEGWVRRSFALAARDDLEIFLYPRITAATVGRLIEIRGLENLASAIERGRGAILYSGHVRGQGAFFAALALLGYPPNVISRGVPSPRHPIDLQLSARRTAFLEHRLGCRFLQVAPDPGVAFHAARALQRNQVVTIAIDLPLARQNVEVRFLDGVARFPSGAALLAQVTGAPLLSFFVHHAGEARPPVAEIGPPYHPSPPDDLAACMQHCASRLEEKIREHPGNWNTWLFPIWGEDGSAA